MFTFNMYMSPPSSIKFLKDRNMSVETEKFKKDKGK
jgi:hypothetical protein